MYPTAVQSEVNRLLEASFSKNTHASHITGLAAFDTFRHEQGLSNTWPPTLDQLAHFIATLSIRGLAPNTVHAYISAISTRCKLSSVVDTTKHFVITKLLEGMKRSTNKLDTRLPITGGLLSKLLSLLPQTCINGYEAKLFRAAFSLAFFGFLRVGELTVTKGVNPDKIIGIHDIMINKSAAGTFIKLYLSHSKTDQAGKGITIMIPSVPALSCPVTNLRAFLQDRPNVPGPLFCHFNGQPLTRYQFSSVLHKTLKCLGFDSSRYRTHSFRIGAATTAAMAGHSQEVIQNAGRWKSQAYKSYIRCPLTTIPADIIS